MSNVIKFPKTSEKIKREALTKAVEEHDKKIKEDLKDARIKDIAEKTVYFTLVGVMGLVVIGLLYLL
jgi:hypothetical protein